MFPLFLSIALVIAQATAAPAAQATAAPAAPAPTAAPRTLAGVALGASLPDSVVHDPATKQFPNPLGAGTISKWHRIGAGGTVTVVTNADGLATRIEFVADDKEHDIVDLPCAPAFSLTATAKTLDAAAQQASCNVLDAGTYRLPDGSVFAVQFGAAAGAPLLEAIWYRADGA
jgi:hypothetical protein